MLTGIEKFKDVVDTDLCDSLIRVMNLNIPNSLNRVHSQGQNVICREINLQLHSELDSAVFDVIGKVIELYKEKYPFFRVSGDTGYQLRKITGDTRIHVDNITKDYRNTSVILGLNSDYEEGEFHFPYQDFSTTVKRGEAIVFPVYFMYPHFVDAPIGSRYTINTWLQDSDTSFK
tara:strand:- start:110 stop:634 length:525 start_codon:yes stop_codon:yes gene_type:complete